MYTSRGEYLYHELTNHEEAVFDDKVANRTRKSIQNRSKQSVLCHFCEEPTGTGKNGRAAHVGRHMEEIAFTVCNVPYQEWDFYSDSSVSSLNDSYGISGTSQLAMAGMAEQSQEAEESPLRCNKINPATGRSCDVTYTSRNNLIGHEADIYPKGPKELRCSYCPVRKVFPRKRPTQCPICRLDSESFKNQAGLQEHMRSVHPDVPWPCPIPSSARPKRSKFNRVKAVSKDSVDE